MKLAQMSVLPLHEAVEWQFSLSASCLF